MYTLYELYYFLDKLKITLYTINANNLWQTVENKLGLSCAKLRSSKASQPAHYSCCLRLVLWLVKRRSWNIYVLYHTPISPIYNIISYHQPYTTLTVSIEILLFGNIFVYLYQSKTDSKLNNKWLWGHSKHKQSVCLLFEFVFKTLIFKIQVQWFRILNYCCHLQIHLSTFCSAW